MGVRLMIELLPSNYEVLSSNPNTRGKKGKTTPHKGGSLFIFTFHFVVISDLQENFNSTRVKQRIPM
jgi:hypothetical protein